MGLDRALLIVVSAPSGCGKTTLCDRLLADCPDMVYSVSCTTRPTRGNEVDGEDYFFLSDEQFEAHVKDDAFLEHALVHGHRYGTLRETVRMALEDGSHVLMDIDVQGAKQIRDAVRAAGPDDLLRRGYIDIFVRPPSIDALRARLENRAEDTAEVIEARLEAAEREMKQMGEYRYIVVNDDLEQAYGDLREVVLSEMRTHG